MPAKQVAEFLGKSIISFFFVLLICALCLAVYHAFIHAYIKYFYTWIYSYIQVANGTKTQISIDDKISIGIVGDSVAVLALCFLILSVSLNTQAIKIQQEELTLTRKEMRSQKKEMKYANKHRIKQLMLQAEHFAKQEKLHKEEQELKIIFELVTEYDKKDYSQTKIHFSNIHDELEKIKNTDERHKVVTQKAPSYISGYSSFIIEIGFWKRVALAFKLGYVTKKTLIAAFPNIAITKTLVEMYKMGTESNSPLCPKDENLEFLYENLTSEPQTNSQNQSQTPS